MNSQSSLTALVLCLISVLFCSAQDDEKGIFSSLRLNHRVNAHGDEFMSMDTSPDRSRIAVGTEKGDVYIWNVAASKLDHQFHEGHPLHQVVFIDDGHIVIAGGDHTGVHNCLFGRLDIASGKFEEWSGAGSESLTYLSFDHETGTVVTANPLGPITAWDVRKGSKLGSWNIGKPIASMILAGGDLLVSRLNKSIQELSNDDDQPLSGDIAVYSISAPTAKPRVFLAPKDGLAGKLTISPDKKILSANVVEGEEETLKFYDVATGEVTGVIERPQLNLHWIKDRRALISDNEEPLQFVTVEKDKGVRSEEITKGGGFHGNGNPTGVSGISVSPDEKTAWITYEKLGSLVQFDLTNKTSKGLIYVPPFPYAMDVRESASTGYLATAGDDKYVRIRDLTDLHLIREIATQYTPQGVALMPDGRTVIYSASSDTIPTDVISVDVQTGNSQKLMTLPAPFARVRKGGDGFLYEIGTVTPPSAADTDKKPKVTTTKLVQATTDGKTVREYSRPNGIGEWATSHNAGWMVISDNDHKLSVFDLSTGQAKNVSGDLGFAPSHLAVTSDGRYVFGVGFTEPLKRWDVSSGEVKTIAEYRPVASSLTLSADEKFAIIGGSHYDIGVYEIATGKLGLSTRVDASDFYVPQTWMKGTRLIYITDEGVLFDGTLQK